MFRRYRPWEARKRSVLGIPPFFNLGKKLIEHPTPQDRKPNTQHWQQPTTQQQPISRNRKMCEWVGLRGRPNLTELKSVQTLQHILRRKEKTFCL